jgi:hypothetical protein
MKSPTNGRTPLHFVQASSPDDHWGIHMASKKSPARAGRTKNEHMKNQAFLLLLILNIAGSFAGAVLKIMHAPGADILLAVALIAGFVFAALALSEILPSSINKPEKLMWIFGFLFLNWIAVILYLAIGRNRILGLGQKSFSRR